jgi:hypothetical protein
MKPLRRIADRERNVGVAGLVRRMDDAAEVIVEREPNEYTND